MASSSSSGGPHTTNPPLDLTHFAEIGNKVADAAKSSASSVTIADQSAKEAMVSIISHHFPQQREMVMASKRIKKKAEKKGSKMLLKKGDIFKAIFRVNGHNRLEFYLFFDLKSPSKDGSRSSFLILLYDLPTISEVVTGMTKKQGKEKSSVSNHSCTKAKLNSKVVVACCWCRWLMVVAATTVDHYCFFKDLTGFERCSSLKGLKECVNFDVPSFLEDINEEKDTSFRNVLVF
ncbi:hypothetical protein RIF29_27900 [Crotalaria pallida]|uniref:Uncharacterized protein n=1 Tax=Crotalaria pallida TaxID=3830 RepID=A0AAN9ESA4_CROPI